LHFKQEGNDNKGFYTFYTMLRKISPHVVVIISSCIKTQISGHRYQEAHLLLNSEQGIQKRKKRCWDVESVFGNIKQNHRFRRFMLKGKEKVEIEWGLLAIAQNLRKKAA
jgi:hypothetical protein